MAGCQFKTNSDDGWVECGKPATVHATLPPYYDLDLCDEHATLFRDDYAWKFTNLSAS